MDDKKDLKKQQPAPGQGMGMGMGAVNMNAFDSFRPQFLFMDEMEQREAKKNPDITVLSKLIRTGDLDGIDKWFATHINTHINTNTNTNIQPLYSQDTPISEDFFLKSQHSLSSLLSPFTVYKDLTENHLFSFWNHVGNNYEDDSFWVKVYEDAGVKQRDVAVLKHFPLVLQLDFLNNMMKERCDASYMHVLNYDKNNVQDVKVLADFNKFGSIVTHLFHQEDFEALEILYEKTGLDLMNQHFNAVRLDTVFLYSEPLAQGVLKYPTTSYVFSNNDFCVKYEFIIHPSEAKQAWLESKGIALPTLDETRAFKAAFLDTIENKANYKANAEHYSLWQSRFKQHEIRIHYDLLQEKIEQNIISNTTPNSNDADKPSGLKI
jgi:hypothetical protein